MTVDGSGPYVGDICHVTRSINLASIMKRGLMPGHIARTSAATMLQMSPFPPFDDWKDQRGDMHPRTN
eukprot:5232082-Alexandrium_andersonii.AAC.1